jgi:hypothetical protein
LRVPQYLDNRLTDGGKVVSLTLRPPLMVFQEISESSSFLRRSLQIRHSFSVFLTHVVFGGDVILSAQPPTWRIGLYTQPGPARGFRVPVVVGVRFLSPPPSPRAVLGPTQDSFPRGAKLSTHLHLAPRSKIHGSIHPLPHTSSWRSA